MATQMELEIFREIGWPPARRTFREERQQQSQVIFRLSFNVYTDLDNRERPRAGD